MLNNPIGAMIPNFDNGGGSTGGGSGLPMSPNAGRQTVGGVVQNLPPVFDPKQKDPTEGMTGIERFYYGVGNALQNMRLEIPAPPPYVRPSTPSTPQNQQPVIDPDKPMQASGIYAAPEQALLYYMQRGEVNQIPSNMADSMGLTSVLQDPNSGWVMKNGQWTQQADTGAVTGAQNIGGQTLYKTESGARLDQSGNVVWNPETATRDVYGGQFVAEGTTKWERGKDGKVRRVVWRNGRKQTIRGGGGGGGSAPVSKPKPRAQFTGGYGVVNFNTGSG